MDLRSAQLPGPLPPLCKSGRRSSAEPMNPREPMNPVEPVLARAVRGGSARAGHDIQGPRFVPLMGSRCFAVGIVPAANPARSAHLYMSDRPHEERTVRDACGASGCSFLQSRSNCDQYLQIVLIQHGGEQRDAPHRWAIEPPNPSTLEFLACEVDARIPAGSSPPLPGSDHMKSWAATPNVSANKSITSRVTAASPDSRRTT